MEYSIAFLGMVSTVVIGCWFYSTSPFVGFFYAAILSTLSVFGYINLNLVFIVLSFFLLLFSRGGKVKIRIVKVMPICLVLLFLLALGPMQHGFGAVPAVSKWIKTVIIILPLLFITKDTSMPLDGVLKSFVISSVVFGCLYSVLCGFDEGIYQTPRFAGFFADSNYFAIICLISLVYFDYFKTSNYKAWMLICVLLVFSSQSVTFVSFTLFYLVFRRFSIIHSTPKLIVAFPLLVGFVYIYTINAIFYGATFEVMSDYDTNAVALKVNSIIFRLRPQLGALELMHETPSIFWFGFGSGQSAELFGRVLHNAYMQVLFDNGVLFFTLLFCLTGYYIYRSRIPLFLVVTIFLSNFLFDNIFMFVFTFVALLFHYRKHNESPKKRVTTESRGQVLPIKSINI